MVRFDNLPGEEVPFVADANDIEPHGREIFERAKNGEFGPIGAVSYSEVESWPQVSLESLPNWPEIQEILARANVENALPTEIGTVVLWTTVLDHMLARALLATGVSAPGKFARRIDAAFRHKLIDKDQRCALHLIREIRNTFAHESLATLDSPVIEAKLSEIYNLTCNDGWRAPEPKMYLSAGAATLAMHLYSKL
ncbi:hypothetical protein [Mesorhizobium koreense]|uniref:hypothetical protein n=1 Tax=Mesorhizobium koreense TaxID=3074855 RepID=UPI00287BB3AB|nr:hypothetical protein [Mesorhizobium sp. WR6]